MAKKKTRKPREPRVSKPAVSRQRVPRTRAGNTWTEARFWQFLRSNLRKLHRRWPPLRQAELANRRQLENTGKLKRYEYHCRHCEHWFKKKDGAMHHIVPCGSLKCWEDVVGFIQRLLCEADGYCFLCDTCHEEEHRD